MTSPISPPTLLTANHDATQFQCGQSSLDEWLVKRALRNQAEGASRTFVICEDSLVIGYYALATGAVERAHATKNVARNMPDPIPVIVLGRLAIHRDRQGQGLGPALLRDAVMRTAQAADLVGIRAMLVHPIDDNAVAFYEHFGFAPSPTDPKTLMISLRQIRHALGL